MKTLYFMDMYYPSDTQELRQYCSVTPRDCHTPSLILLPHSSLEFIHGMYQDAFSQIHNPRRIVVMAPVHGQKFEDDASSSLFTFSSGDVMTPLGPVRIQAVDGVKVNDSYAEEEYAVELFYPYVALNSPDSVVLPILTALESKEDIQALSRLIVRLKKEENDTVFIISGNFTQIGRSEEINQMARTLNELLENNAPLLDAAARKKISGCAYRMMEASRTAIQGHFRIIQARCGNYVGENLTSEADGRIWQVYGTKG